MLLPRLSPLPIAGALAAALTACSGGAATNPTQGQDASAFAPPPASVASRPGIVADAAIPQPLPEPPVAARMPAISGDLTAPILNESGSYTNGPIVRSTNTATAGYGIEGITDGSGAGLYGHSGSTSATSYGAYGFSAGGAGVYGYDSSAGDGVLGASTQGDGVVGTTTHDSSSDTYPAEAGVLGEDLSTHGFYDAGIEGKSTDGTGVIGIGPSGVVGETSPSVEGDAVEGISAAGVGVYAESDSPIGDPALYGLSESSSTPALILANLSEDTMSIDHGGNMILLGNLTVDGTITGSSTTKPLISSPGRGAQIESVGDGQLSGGTAYVHIDGDFAGRIDPSQPYHVFLTPNGDCNGLYVAGKTSGGFTVRELHHGSASLSFDYRIVATERAAPLPRPLQTRVPRTSVRP